VSFDRARCREIHDALDEALQPLGRRLGLTIRLGGGSFTAGNIRRNCLRYGLQAEDLNKTFTWGGREFVLVGCSPRASRFPLLGRSSDGKVFKFPADIAGVIRPGARPLPVFRRTRGELPSV
jgi:hypothetical protein